MLKFPRPQRPSVFQLLSLATLAVLLAGLLSAFVPVAAALASPIIVEYSGLTGSTPRGITAGPDGNLWFVEVGGNKVGKITTSGVVTEYKIPTTSSSPLGITTGPDGNLWFTEGNGNKIGKITTSGVITEYPGSSTYSYPHDITTGPDGNLWFTEQFGSNIGKITTAGVVTEYPIPTASNTWGITVGSDGNLWFTEDNDNRIGKITTSGVITEYTIPTSGSVPIGITAGPDGNLWFAEGNGNKIGKITTAGVFTEYTVPTAGSSPQGITVGPDGNLWFTETGGNKIGTITISGVITEYSVPSASSAPYGITVGSDGNLWFTELSGNKIGKVMLPPTITLSPSSLPNATQGQSYSQIISANGGSTPYSYTLTGGSLPSGLNLASDGTLSGTPVVNGSFNFTVTATDKYTFTGQQAYTLVVNPPGASQADLALSLSSPTTGGGYGQQFTLTATLTNNGPADATGVSAKISLPKGLGLLANQPAAGTTFDPNSGVWTVGKVANGASLSLILILKVQDNGQLKVTAQITALNETDSNLTNNTATFLFNVTPPKVPAEVSAQLRVTPDRVVEATEGGTLTLNLTARNVGPGQARLVYAKVPFDPNLLEPSASSFPDRRDWVKQVVTKGDTTYLEIRFHDLNIYEQASGSVTFQVKPGVKAGTQLNLRFTIVWDDDNDVGRSRQSNVAHLSFAEQGQNVNDGSAYPFDPAQVTLKQGEMVTLKGDFFSPLEKVELWYTDQAGKSVSLGYQWADQEGKVRATIATADLSAGTYNISASGYYSQVQGTMTLTVKSDEPNSFDPAQANVKPGDALKLNADCFSAGEKVTYWYAGGDGQSVELGYAWADKQGQISIALDTTKFGAGEYTIMAHGNTSGVEAKMHLSVGSK
jgi:uncharacterized repeat protein (TIGR01451 family)